MKKKTETGAYFTSLEEATYHLKIAYSDILGYFTYQGFTGLELIKQVNSFVKKSCNEVIEDILPTKNGD